MAPGEVDDLNRFQHRQQFNWGNNLAGVWVAIFAIQVGIGFSQPYVALYLYQDFAVHDPARLALLTGIVVSCVSFSAAGAGFVWGAIGDRYGRRLMLIRAMAGAAITIIASGLAPNVTTLIATRVAMGLSSGISPAGTAIVAEGTPPARLAWALGITASARAVGQAVGPMLGGLLATLLALRIIFVSGGILLLIALVPVALLVREPRWADSRRERVSMRQAISQAAPGTVLTIVVLSASLGLAFLSVTGMQQLMVLRILSFHPALAALATGITFTAFGIATAFAATFYSRLVGKWGFRGIAILSAGLLSCAIAASAVVPNVSLLVSCAAFAGLTYGALFPTLNSMLGLEAPARLKATVFGFAASLTSFGNGLGPLLGGTIAAIAGVRWALFAIAIAALVAAALVGVWGRQPVPEN